MNREDIIRMAREAGFSSAVGKHIALDAELERFAALIASRVAAAERNRTWTQDHWTEYERSIAAAAKAEEREACAKVCEQEWNKYCVEPSGYALAVNECAAAIRARSKQ